MSERRVSDGTPQFSRLAVMNVLLPSTTLNHECKGNGTEHITLTETKLPGIARRVLVDQGFSPVYLHHGIISCQESTVASAFARRLVTKLRAVGCLTRTVRSA